MSGRNIEDVSMRLKLEKGRQFKQGVDGAGKSVRGLGKDAKKASAGMRAASAASDKLRGASRILGATLTAGVGAGLVALGYGVKKSVEGWRDHELVLRQTNAVLKSTGGAAKASAKHIESLANSVENATSIDNDLVQAGENILLTFTNIRNAAGKGNNIFDRTTRAAVDLSAAMTNAGKSMSVSDAALQLGKALNDPAKGMAKLMRVGVSFTQEQQEQIKRLVESGDTLKAQKIILREVGKEFGGSAKAANDPMKQLGKTLRDIQDKVGKALVPFLNKGAKALNKLIKQMQNGTGTGGKLVKKAKEIGEAVNKYVVQPLKKAAQWIAASNDRTTALAIGIGVVTVAIVAFGIATAIAASPVYLVIAALGLLAAGFYYAYQRSKTFRDALGILWKVLGYTNPIAIMIQHLDELVNFVKKLPGRIKTAASGIWDGIKSGAVAAVNFAIDKVNWLIRAFNNTLGRVPGVPNVGELQKLGAGPVEENTKASRGYTGTGGPAPTGRKGRDTGNAVGRDPLAPINLKSDVHITLDGDDINANTLKRARNRARRR